MTPNPTPFELAQALRIMLNVEHRQPEQETKDLAFAAAMLQAGWGNQEITDAITAAHAAAGNKPKTTNSTLLYTLTAYDIKNARPREALHTAFIESIRPGILKRHQETERKRVANRPRWDMTNMMQDLVFDDDLDLVTDNKLRMDVDKACKSARQAVNQARVRDDNIKTAQ